MNKSHLCPEWETLSAGHDGQPGTERVRLHAQECPECRRQMEILRQLDGAIASAPACDAAALARIKAGTRRKLRQPLAFLAWWPVTWRAAASVVLVGAMFLVHQFLKQQPAPTMSLAEQTALGIVPGTPPATVPVAGQPDSPILPPLAGAESETWQGTEAQPTATAKLVADKSNSSKDRLAITRPLPSPNGGGVKLGDTRLVAIGSAAPKGGRPHGQDDSISPPPEREVGDYVWHVWLVDDPAKALRELQSLLPNNQADFQRLISENRDRYLLQLMISDRNLETLVTRLNDQGMRLLSPAAPQPGATALRLSGKAVQYEVDFVRR
jgi:hypothetical protein